MADAAYRYSCVVLFVCGVSLTGHYMSMCAVVAGPPVRAAVHAASEGPRGGKARREPHYDPRACVCPLLQPLVVCFTTAAPALCLRRVVATRSRRWVAPRAGLIP